MPAAPSALPPPPPLPPTASTLARCNRWVQVKKYQFEVHMSLYMLSDSEKVVFYLIMVVMTLLFLAAVKIYLPNHLRAIYDRIWYYINGEFRYMTASNARYKAFKASSSAASAARAATVAAQKAASSVSAVGGNVAKTISSAAREAGSAAMRAEL